VDTLSIYLHIPFCRHRCAYCDFNTYTGLADLQAPYARALALEAAQVAQLAQVAGATRPVHTLFFGGGTPSLMDPADLGHILARVGEAYTLTRDAEVTMEANPGTVDIAYLEQVRELGVNRLSFGMQSAIPGELTFLERAHDHRTVVKAIEMSRAAGFENVSVDLIYGVPGQTIHSWEKSLQAALALDLEHISLYCLTIEPGTPLHRDLRNGVFAAPDPDLAADQYELACTMLDERGFVHYEISNWARPGRECRHNLTYWRNGEYLGLGAGAHGHAAGVRYSIVKQPRTYIKRMAENRPGAYPLSAATADKHRLSTAEMMSDLVITQLRLLEEGLNLAAFADRFGREFNSVYGEEMNQLVGWGLLREQAGRLLLTKQGWFLSNQVFYRFV
jgi:oxygen-independent coproporphyrinogen-3 oxidase